MSYKLRSVDPSLKTRGIWKILIFFLFLYLYANVSNLSAQDLRPGESGGKPDPQLSQKDNDYLDRQAKVFLDSVSKILSVYPPVVNENKERTYAKLLLDAVFHEKYAAFRKPVQDFFHARIDQLIKELEGTRVEKGAMIWKVYNMGFIVRTKSVTLAFDLVSGSTSRSPDFALSAGEMERMIRQCDVLFISHRHADHAELEVARQFIKSGKPVISPEQVWTTDPIFSQIFHPERSPDKVHKIKLSNNLVLDVLIFPGHQMASTDNNVSLATTPEGISIAHLGDQINEGDFMTDYGWIDKVAENHHVDVLITNCWTNDIFRIVRGFNPDLVIPGHELELGHTVWDRVPYWGDDAYLELNYAELKKSKYPVVVMIWGEGYHYYPK